jgi:hypothetical protein
MKTIIAILTTAAIGAAQLQAADPNAKLTKVSIRFDTHNDNKDHDTILNVYVKNKVNMFLSQDVAEGLNLGGEPVFRGGRWTQPKSRP